MTIRSVRPLNLAGVDPATVGDHVPEVRLVEPSTLLVDDDYQRALSERSVTLIRRIVGDWDWARFKPPVVTEVGDGLEVIDGQHTAIAAASHPGIALIPVMVVRTAGKADRAKAFVGHNRDRLNITATQLHFSSVAAGDEDALTIQQVAERAGVRVLKNPPSGGVFKPRDTMAVACIGGLCSRRGAAGARRVLDICAAAELAPVNSSAIKAVEALLHEPEYTGTIDGPDIASTLMRLGDGADQEAKVFAAAHRVPVWRGLAVVLYRQTRKRRRAA